MISSSMSNITLFNAVNLNTQKTNGNVGNNAGAATQGARTARENAGKINTAKIQTNAAINNAQPQVTRAFDAQITGINKYIDSIGQFKASGPAPSGMDFSTAFSAPASGGTAGGFDFTAATGALNASATDTASNFLNNANANFGIAQGAFNTADLVATNAFGSGANLNTSAASGFGGASEKFVTGAAMLPFPPTTAAGWAMLGLGAVEVLSAGLTGSNGNQTADSGLQTGKQADADLAKAGAEHAQTDAKFGALQAEEQAILNMIKKRLAPTQQLADATTKEGLQLLGNQASGQPSGFFVGGAPLGGTAGLSAGSSDWGTPTSTASTAPTSQLATAESDWGTSANGANGATASLTPATGAQDQGGLTPEELAFLKYYDLTSLQIPPTNTKAAETIGGSQHLNNLDPGQFRVGVLPPEIHELAQRLKEKQAQKNGGNQDIAMMPQANSVPPAGGVDANGQAGAGNGAPNGAQNPQGPAGTPTAPGQSGAQGPQGSQAPTMVATASPVADASWGASAPPTANGLTIPGQPVAKTPATPAVPATLGSFA